MQGHQGNDGSNAVEVSQIPSFSQSTTIVSFTGNTLSCSTEIITCDDESYCRICHGRGEEEELFSYCYCKGSVGLIHSSCLILWIQKSRSITCELCKQRYGVSSQLKKLIWQWKFPRVSVLGCLKFLFFIGFLILFLTFTVWTISLAINQPREINKTERNRAYLWISYAVCDTLMLIPVLVMALNNSRSFINYITKCILINKNIQVIPMGILNKEHDITKTATKVNYPQER